jgi:hypothetical protein
MYAAQPETIVLIRSIALKVRTSRSSNPASRGVPGRDLFDLMQSRVRLEDLLCLAPFRLDLAACRLTFAPRRIGSGDRRCRTDEGRQT